MHAQPSRTDPSGRGRRAEDARPASLEHEEVHLWWHRLEPGEPSSAALACLDAEEARRAERFRRREDARAFRARRVFLRSTLARYLGCEPGELVFGKGEFDKPVLVSPDPSLAFNLARSGEWILLGVARERAIGVDVERLDASLREERELERLAARVLSEGELTRWTALPKEQRAPAFVRGWARKEALLKALGLGLSREPNTVEMGLEPLGPLEARPLEEHLFPGAEGALLLDLVAPSGHAASVVAAGRSWNLLLCSRAA